jgi:hypothetical protein
MLRSIWREVERLVVEHSAGDRPTDPRKPDAVPKRITFRLSPETYAMLGEARRALTQRCGHGLDDDSLVRTLAEAVLSGGQERDAGRSAYQVALTVCESCRHATQEGGGEPVAVDGATVAMADCDGQHVGRVDGLSSERASQTIPPRIRRAVLRRHHNRCAAPGCTHAAFVHVHHIALRSEGGTHDPERMLPLCSAHHRAVHDGRLVVTGTSSQGWSCCVSGRCSNNGALGSRARVCRLEPWGVALRACANRLVAVSPVFRIGPRGLTAFGAAPRALAVSLGAFNPLLGAFNPLLRALNPALGGPVPLLSTLTPSLAQGPPVLPKVSPSGGAGHPKRRVDARKRGGELSNRRALPWTWRQQSFFHACEPPLPSCFPWKARSAP